MTDERLEESRRRVQARLVAIGDAADKEVRKAQRVRDAALAVVGVLGVLFTTRKVAKAITGRKRKKDELKPRGRR